MYWEIVSAERSAPTMVRPSASGRTALTPAAPVANKLYGAVQKGAPPTLEAPGAVQESVMALPAPAAAPANSASPLRDPGLATATYRSALRAPATLKAGKARSAPELASSNQIEVIA